MTNSCGSLETERVIRGDAILLVGNPNVGKSVIFGYLTGRYVTVANYPGTTVELSAGKARWNSRSVEVIDTPGVNSLLPVSDEERVTRDILLRGEARLVVQVADAKNLRRALMLSVQLAELGVPFVLNLNMSDEARSRGILIDEGKLAKRLGVPIASTVAIRKVGLDLLRESLQGEIPPATIRVRYPEAIEEAATQMESILPESGISRRGLALMILAGDPSLEPFLLEHLTTEERSELHRLRRPNRSSA
jgi:ferrous iron transport protein B